MPSRTGDSLASSTPPYTPLRPPAPIHPRDTPDARAERLRERVSAAARNAAAAANATRLRNLLLQEQHDLEMAESADAAPATPFSELYALKWLNQTLLDLDGQAKRVGESDVAYENRLTSR